MPANNVNWPTPLTRLRPWYPGQMGVPGTDNETGLRLNTEGCIFWVDPNHPDPNDNRDGTNPDAPLATIGAALLKCEAYRGDTIAVMHNGFWTYGDTTVNHVTPIQENVTIDVPGVRLVGVSPSSLGVPWVPSDDNQTLITVNQLDVTIEGFNFWEPGIYSGTVAIFAQWDSTNALYGENLTVRHCYFYNLDYGITMDYSWNGVIEDCSFLEVETAAIFNTNVQGDPDYLVVRNCIFTNNTADIDLADTDCTVIEANRFLMVTAAITIDGGAYNQIIGNVIQGNPAGVNNMINLDGGSANVVTGNTLTCTIAQYDTTCDDATSGSWGGNWCENNFTTAAPT